MTTNFIRPFSRITSTASTRFIKVINHRWRHGVVVNTLVMINEVTLRRARLVLGWVTVC